MKGLILLIVVLIIAGAFIQDKYIDEVKKGKVLFTINAQKCCKNICEKSPASVAGEIRLIRSKMTIKS